MRRLCNPTAAALRRVHLWLMLAWLAASAPICLVLPGSVAFLVFVSVYAIVVGHWSSWQGARAEQAAGGSAC